jgi:hypothetical protein
LKWAKIRRLPILLKNLTKKSGRRNAGALEVWKMGLKCLIYSVELQGNSSHLQIFKSPKFQIIIPSAIFGTVLRK